MKKTTYFKGKYRNESTRLDGWDYSGIGTYFVTMCAKYRVQWFGCFEDGVMKLSEIGKIIDIHWNTIPQIYKHISLDAYVIMPDHFHGIISFDSQKKGGVGTPQWGVPTPKKYAKPTTLGSVVNQFKGSCTKQIRLIEPEFSWQPRFYDQIIDNEKILKDIQMYIKTNPHNWNPEEHDDFWKLIR